MEETLMRLTCYPMGPGPHDRWELAVEATGEVLLSGTEFPIDPDAIRQAVDAYEARGKVNGG
jgi:hypothetical protein